ncbi:MAG: TonB-dependent receptor [Candidatus Solibacter sp.]|jgi:outer membrane receptor protein involved in Fe transport
MLRKVPGPLACFLICSACLSAAEIKGKIVDPSGAPVSGAQIAAVNRVGVVAQTTAASNGNFQLDVPETPDTRLVVAAPGFSTRTLALDQAASVQLEIAPRTDSVQVVGSTIDLPATLQASSTDVIPVSRVRSGNEPFAMDLLRYVPGVAFNQSGAPGGVASLFLRGGNSNMNLVEIDGVPVIGFGGGLGFDFAHIPSEAVDHIDVVRGAQSAVYGSYANSGVIDFVTRQPGAAPQFDLLAEGGSHNERRFAITGTGTVAGFGLLVSASRYDNDGLVTNDDYRNEDVLLNLTRRFGRQSLAAHGYFDSSEVGEPGPWGSDPKHIFTGIDTVSRSKNNFSEYGAHYEADLSPRLREELFGSFFLYNSGYVSPYGFSFGKDLRGQGEARTIVSVSRHDTASFGVTGAHESVTNSYITDASFSTFPLERDEIAVYAEDRYEVAGRLFLSGGVRAEFFRTASIPGDGYSRPLFPASSISRVNPKLSAAYVAGGTRLHTSFGMGLRPPNGFELAFTDNPALKPERTRSVDAGVERRFGSLLTLDATYFYNRYYDLIVILGGSLTALSHYTSANLANSQAQGGEFSARLRPARSVLVTGSYTLLGTRILSLDGSSNQAPLPFTVGQELTRRPENSGNVVATFTRGRLAADLSGYFRGRTLYEEPNLGASNGLFWNPGFANVGVNLNYTLGRGVTAYGNLRNALNRQYEEVFGYPSPKLNFVAGLKWTIARTQ